MHINKYVVITILFLFLQFSAFAQISPSSIDSLEEIVPEIIESYGDLDSLANGPEYQILSDSLGSMINSNELSTDSLLDESNTVPTRQGDIETTIDYRAKDSIFFDLGRQMMFLYGESKIDYGDITLGAEKISLDWVANTIQANYILDDSTGRKIGKPVFTEKEDSYETDDMIYNFTTKKALINGIVTEQDGAFMHGEKVKKNELNEMFIRGAKYTTCDHAYPHYYIKSSKLKVIPNNKVVSGPFNLYFGEIATPIGFAFGMFPQPKSKSSGILFPSYGEESQRGFFLRNGGYYFDINEYVDLKLTGNIFTNGSYGLQSASIYKWRYHFSGNFNLKYNKTVNPAFEDDGFAKDFWLNWSHTPQSTGSSRFSASVSLGTQSYTQNDNNVATNFQQSVTASFTSNMSYSKTFKGTPFSMSANARHSQNVSTDITSVSLPELSLSMNRQYPLKKINGIGDGVLGKLGISYNMVMKNELSNSALSNTLNAVNFDDESAEQISFNSDNLSILLDRAKQGMKHTIPLATSFNMLKFITVSPTVNYTEVWYPRELSFSYDDELEGVRVDTLRKFSRAGWYSSGASMSTRLYGMYNFGKGRVKAIRHVMTPSVGFSYSPDFSDPSRGTYSKVKINEDGDTALYSKFQNFAYGGPSSGESASLSFSLNHNLEMKMKTKNDSIDETKKIKIFDNLSMSTGYDFLKDSFQLADINWNARTSLFNGKVSINMSGALNPYVYVLDSVSSSDVVYDREINQYAWNNGQGLGQLSRGNIAIGFNLKPKEKSKGDESEKEQSDESKRGEMRDVSQINDNGFGDTSPLAGSVNNFISKDPNVYVPFDVPWALNVNYSLNYSKQGFDEASITQTLNFSGNLNITDKTNISFNSGYDLKSKEFTVTRLNVGRDLHCWTVNFNWVPFGVSQSYFIEIRVNSQLLKDLKLDKRSRSTYSSFQ